MGLEGNGKASSKILIVDDIQINLDILESILEEEGYQPLCALNVQEAIDIMNESLPQLILSDFSMPGMDGLEFCRLLKSNPRTRDIPFLFITVLDSTEEKEQAFKAGAVDFILKPFDRVEIIMRIKNQLDSYKMKQEMANYNRMMHKLVSEQEKQIEAEQENMLFALAKMVEKRSLNLGGTHLEKIGYNSQILAQSLQLLPDFEKQITDEFIETIGTASKIHDIGNITIPDQLLLKEDLEELERDIVWSHTTEGAKLLEEIKNNHKSSRFIDMAIQIAKYHHERWDGTGYPEKLKGTQIPLEARIVMLVNDFDKLLSKKKSYKDIYFVEESIKTINEGKGTAYEPAMVDVFNKVWRQMKL